MSAQPLISIVTPSFNQGKFIEETILSFIGQSYPQKELIIIDGGSTDNTIDVIKKYSEHIAYWVSEPDHGQTDAIRKGLEKCKGEIFNWINSDDKLAENALERVAQLYMQKNCPDLIAGSIYRFDEKGNRVLHPHINHHYNIFKTLGFGQMCQPGMFYKTQIVRQTGLNTTLHYSMDVDLYFRYNLLLENPRTVYTNDILAEFRVHGDSKTAQETDKKMHSRFLGERLTIFRFFATLFSDNKMLAELQTLYPGTFTGELPVDAHLSSSKKTLLHRAYNYFLLDQLMSALYVFDKKMIRALLFRINWLKVERQYTRKVIGKLFRHGFLFFGNLPRRVARAS